MPTAVKYPTVFRSCSKGSGLKDIALANRNDLTRLPSGDEIQLRTDRQPQAGKFHRLRACRSTCSSLRGPIDSSHYAVSTHLYQLELYYLDSTSLRLQSSEDTIGRPLFLILLREETVAATPLRYTARGVELHGISKYCRLSKNEHDLFQTEDRAKDGGLSEPHRSVNHIRVHHLIQSITTQPSNILTFNFKVESVSTLVD